MRGRRWRIPGVLPEPGQVRVDERPPDRKDALVLEDVEAIAREEGIPLEPDPGPTEGPGPDASVPAGLGQESGERGNVPAWGVVLLVVLALGLLVGWAFGGMRAAGTPWLGYAAYGGVIAALVVWLALRLRR